MVADQRGAAQRFNGLPCGRLFFAAFLYKPAWGGPCHLSVVLCGRNDQHAGDFLDRLRWSLFSMALGLCRHRHILTAEILIVEWRPPRNQLRLADLIPEWLLHGNHKGDFDCPTSMMPPIRIVQIDDQTAEAATSNLRRPTGYGQQDRLFQWQCKAVGLRRAAGEFLLATNADNIWSPMLFRFLSAGHVLRKDSFFLTHIVEFEAPLKVIHERGVPFFQVYDDLFSGKRGWHSSIKQHMLKLEERYPVIRHQASRFLCAYSTALPVSFRSAEFQDFWAIYDHMFGVRLGVSDPLSDAGKPPCMGRFWNFFDAQPGDFILAPREAWHRIGGPPMLFQNMYVDYLVVCRLSALLRQVVLSYPCFMYHQAHLNVTQSTEYARVENELTAANVWMRCCQPFEGAHLDSAVNVSDWGFAELRLPESVVQHRSGGGVGDLVIRNLE